MRFRIFTFLATIAMTLVWAFGSAHASCGAKAKPCSAVVELFTSLACKNCPPADATLSKIARRPDVLALSYHVDYLNTGRVKDPLSSELWTLRQMAYKSAHGSGYIYTPQIIINGTTGARGSDETVVLDALDTSQLTEPVFTVEKSNEGQLELLLADEQWDAKPSVLVLDIHFRKLAHHKLKTRNGKVYDRINTHSVVDLKAWEIDELKSNLDQFSWTPKDFVSDGRALLVQDVRTGEILGSFWQYKTEL